MQIKHVKVLNKYNTSNLFLRVIFLILKVSSSTETSLKIRSSSQIKGAIRVGGTSERGWGGEKGRWQDDYEEGEEEDKVEVMEHSWFSMPIIHCNFKPIYFKKNFICMEFDFRMTWNIQWILYGNFEFHARIYKIFSFIWNKTCLNFSSPLTKDHH